MTDLWVLPEKAVLGGDEYPHRTHWRDAMKLMVLLGDDSRPERLRWYIALEYFYLTPIPQTLEGEAMAYLADFLCCGQPGKPGAKLFDWQLDANAIIADVNRVCGGEVRQTDMHWWSFLSYFNAIGEGQLSTLVTIRDKLHRGQKLTDWEKDFYRRNKDRVVLRRPETDTEKQEKQRLLALLDG